MNAAQTLQRSLQIAQKPLPAQTAPELASDWLPTGYEPFDKQGKIDMPVIGASAVVLSLQAAAGWQGLIKRFSANITGPGFVQGDGSLIWTITRNGVPVRGYDALVVEMGKLENPRLTDGIVIASGQTIQLLISNVSYGGGGNVIGTFAGVFRQNR